MENDSGGYLHLVVLEGFGSAQRLEALSALPVFDVSRATFNNRELRLLNKWRARGLLFARFVDGEKVNINSDNLTWVSVFQWLAHQHWTVDYDIGITGREKVLAKCKTFQDKLVACVSVK